MPGGIHPPLTVVATWPSPNYVDPTERSKAVVIVACILGPLTITLLFARLWVRIRMQHSAGLDDWLMVAAMVPTIAVTVISPLCVDVYHFNRHVWDVPIQFFSTQRKFVMAGFASFSLASGLIKISILLFYRRMSSRSISPTFRWATWLTIGFIAAYSFAFMLTPIFGCDPISAYWDQADPIKLLQGLKYKCFNEGAVVFSAAVISTAQDLLTAVLPTCLYWKLQIPFRQKAALFGIFAIGYGVVAVGALRSYYSWKIFFETYDVTWYGWDFALWGMVELHVGTMCANAPALKVFFKEYLKLDTLTARSKSGSGGYGAKNVSSTPSGSSGRVSSFWKFGHGKDGYLSEPHTEISVDFHGGVHVQKDIHISHSPSPSHGSTDVLSGQFNDDIEMGKVETRPEPALFAGGYSQGRARIPPQC